jgi:AraC family transcriptional regulator of adaptative response / DNA-3-methyladenine glycosylase II
MRPDDERCWQATQERDARLDGAFVVGVRTTGIYCRPSCAARALRRNMTFLDSPAAARRMGLRACRRCHPDDVAREWVRHDLKPVSPFDGDRLRAFLGQRAVPGVEEVDGDVYRRSLALPGGPAIAELDLGQDRAVARVRLTVEDDLPEALRRLHSLTAASFEPAPMLAVLGPLAADAPGLRAPGTVDRFELAIRAVLGQQVSVAGARTLAARLVGEHGKRLHRPVGGVTHLFPTRRALARLDPATLAMPRSRARALIGLARSGVPEGRDALLALAGIGPWTADYIALRTGDPDAFPAGDLGIKHGLEKLGIDESAAEAWRPYRAYAVHHLWASL